jgi:hypothetical protein
MPAWLRIAGCQALVWQVGGYHGREVPAVGGMLLQAGQYRWLRRAGVNFWRQRGQVRPRLRLPLMAPACWLQRAWTMPR